MSDLTASRPAVERDATCTGKRAGLLESAVQKMFMRPARVVAIEELGSTFRMVTFNGPALKKAEWTPGDKIQLQLGGWVQRTYTPLDWDPEQGSTRILVYLHGDGPGANWARQARPGDECILFGPRASIDPARLQSPVFVFGDETSFGLVAALQRVTRATARVVTALEITPSRDTQATIQALRLVTPQVYERSDNDAHLAAMEAQALDLLYAHPSASFVLTGKAASVQRIRQFLRWHGSAGSHFQNKAYWAPGKKGMD